MTPQTIAPAPPVAPDFPVQWDDPAEAELFWQQDNMHFPDPLVPMEAAMLTRSLAAGFSHALNHYNAPLERTEIRSINGYQYQAMVPFIGTGAEMAARGALAAESVMAAVGRLDALWEDDILPEVREHLAFWDAFDLAGASRAEIAAHVAETWTRIRRMWELHFEMVLPAYLAISEFDELYRGLFEDAGSLDSYRLMEGLPNMTVQVGQELWQLSRRAIESPAVRDVIATHAAADIPAALYATSAGRAFLAELEEYLDRYGRRADKWTMVVPSWTEDPTPAIERLREFVTRSDAQEPSVVTGAASAGREAAIADARERLAGYPAAVVGQFEALLHAGQAGTVISEDHNFWIDMQSIHHIRQVLLEAGRRLAVEDCVATATDVFMLEPEELADALAQPGGDLREIVAERTAELERQALLTPPKVLGTMPSAPPPDDPFGRFAAKFSGMPVAPENPGELRGSAGSAGVVRGTARVIRSIAEAGRIQPGDILVAETTAPPWTPLFATVAAVVTDTGGVLSHCAVVAREYAIPAVVGTGVASAVIADGQTIEVDGDAGIVRIV